MSKPSKQKLTNESKALDVGIVLDAYMRARAAKEGVGYDLEPAWFAFHLMGGMRFFFGVQVAESGELVLDAQEPAPGFLCDWLDERDRKLAEAN